MKKISVLFFAIAVLSVLASLPVFADTEAVEKSSDFTGIGQTANRPTSLNTSSAMMRINELSSRVTELERDFRFQSDRVRQLEREVSDLRRNN